jgi:protein TonB
MKFIFLALFLTISYCINAQETPPPPPPVADSLNQYSKDTVGIFEKVDVEASFPGGMPAWKRFLSRNLDASAPLKDLPRKTKNFEQTAICQFIVCKDGTICDIKVVNKVLPSIKKEVERVIKLSGNWTPAEQNGKKVKAYRKQPVTFVVMPG